MLLSSNQKILSGKCLNNQRLDGIKGKGGSFEACAVQAMMRPPRDHLLVTSLGSPQSRPCHLGACGYCISCCIVFPMGEGVENFTQKAS